MRFEEEIRQLENKKKRLIQEQKEQERKDRANRLCKRMGLFEKLLPDTIPSLWGYGVLSWYKQDWMDQSAIQPVSL